jgi:Carboxypeptidase regulatory-like domain
LQSLDFKCFIPRPCKKNQNLPTLAFCGIGAILLLLFIAVPAQAQYNASLQGTVADAQGALVPGATLTLTDKETNRTLKATSNNGGDYVFTELLPSIYKLEVSRDGFKTQVIDNLKILSEQANALNVKLDVGGTAETVTVNASTQPLIDTETGAISGTIDQNDIAKMPSFGRDVFQLVQLAPGMFGDGSQQAGGGTNSLPGNQGDSGSGATAGVFQTENKPQVFGNGGRNDTNGISLDGVAITSVTWGSAAVITPSEDSIKEMKVDSNEYDAEFGRTSGAQIQVISQNGTNAYHGTAFIKLDRPGLNAYQRWDYYNDPQRNTSRFNQVGGTLGGPILHNKVFGFFSYETIRNNATSTGDGWYDTASFDTEAPSGSIASQFLGIKGAGAAYTKILEDPNDNTNCAGINLVQGVTCNWIQGQGLDVGTPLTGFALGTHDPSYQGKNPTTGVFTPGLGGDGTGGPENFDGKADIMYVAYNSPNISVNQQFNGRLDYQATGKDLLAASLYYVPTNSTSYNGPNRASNIFYSNTLNYSTGALWNHTFSSTTLNEARVDMAGWKYNQIASNPQTPFGLPDANITSSFNGPNGGYGSPYGNASVANFGPDLGGLFDQWTFNVKDRLTKVYKSHDLKFGGQVTRLAYLDAPTWDGEPSYNFNNMWDFLNDAPELESVTADPRTGIPSIFRKDDRQNVLAFFAQDDWKIKPNLTINLGLRWEYFGGMTEKKGNEANVRLGAGSAELTGLNIQLGGSQVNAQKGNFGPEIGFAFSPARQNNKLVLRGGIGLSYNGLEEAITTNTRNNPPFLANGASLIGSQILYATAPNPYEPNAFPSNPYLITPFNSANLPTNGVPTSVTGLPTDFPTTYVYHYSLEAQYDVGQGWVATLGYQGSTGRHLPLQTNLYNQLAPAILGGQLAMNPIVNSIDWYEDTGNSSFNAMLAEMRHQFSRTFEADAQYRWAKSLDDGSGPYTTPDYEFLPGYNHGPSDFDSRQMIKIFGMYSPVFFHGNSLAEKIAGGWTLSPIFNFHSGFPFDPTYGGLGCNAFYANSGDCNLRAASFTGGAGTSDRTNSFKTAAGHFPKGGASYFTEPAVVPQTDNWSTDVVPTLGPLPQAPGIGRNAFVGPLYSDWDMALTKAFGLPTMKILGEGGKLELRANAYNLFNKLNLDNAQLDTNITDTNFGVASNGGNHPLGSRTVEVEAHFKF